MDYELGTKLDIIATELIRIREIQEKTLEMLEEPEQEEDETKETPPIVKQGPTLRER